MKKILSVLGLVLAFTFGANVFVANALAGDHRDMARGGPGMMKAMSILSELDLSDEQRAAIKNLRHEIKAAFKANKDAHIDFRDEMKAQVQSDHFDETAVRELLASKQQKRIEMGVMHAKMRNGVWNILTEEQRTLMTELMAKRGERGHHKGKRHGRHGERHSHDHEAEQGDDQ